MPKKTLPCPHSRLQEIACTYPTPFHLYDEAGIKVHAKRLKHAFRWNEGFKEYFAVKAAPNPFLMKLFASEGFGSDCSSLPELLLSEQVGITGESIMFTSNDTPAEEFIKARQLGAIINLDDLSHLSYLATCAGMPDLICFRYNPGKLKQGNAIIGNPEDAKYGLTREQLFTAYAEAKKLGATRFGLHTMVASNELNPDYFVETARLLFQLVAELSQHIGIRFEFVNMGGGIGIPYREEQDAVNLEQVSHGIEQEYHKIIKAQGLAPLKLYMEAGRMMTGPYGYLVSRVRHLKHIYKDYVGLDACMANLMRPALYGAYHHITVVGKEQLAHDHKYDVTGSLCENNDKFAIDRMLPAIEPGDLVVIHDAGAHGHAMGFNYNGKLRSAEYLLRTDGSILEIRRAETIDDHFATLNFTDLKQFTP